MRCPLVLALVIACGDSATAPPPQSFEFGPYALAPGQEITNQCVSVTLHNETPIYVNAVELTSGPGFHHSNWFWAPDHLFDGPDGAWRCSDRSYDEASAGIYGGVLFAQSTQSQHEIQAFPPGVAIVLPPHARILAGTHLLNPGDEALSVAIAITITPITAPTTKLAALGFENESIALPPRRASRFTIECDLATRYRDLLGRAPDFEIHYALAHYHELGTGLTIEAVRDDGTSTMIYETSQKIGDALGAAIDPPFSMSGYSKIRASCNYDNPRDTTVRWGVGDQEMCAFMAFSDSPFTWGGGVIARDDPGTMVDHGDYVEYTHSCSVISAPANE